MIDNILYGLIDDTSPPPALAAAAAPSGPDEQAEPGDAPGASVAEIALTLMAAQLPDSPHWEVGGQYTVWLSNEDFYRVRAAMDEAFPADRPPW